MGDSMFEEYIKILKERKRMNKKVNKGYIKIIISIVIMFLGFLLPSFIVGQIPALYELMKNIDRLFMLVTGRNEVITPLLYIGTAFLGTVGTIYNTIRTVINKFKLKQLEDDEQDKLLELKKEYEKLIQDAKNDDLEISNGKKQVLKELKKHIKEEVDSKNNKKKTEILENDNNKLLEKGVVKTKKK